MKNALISPTETACTYTWVRGKQVSVEILNSCRVAEISDIAFEIALPLFWVECNEDVVADEWYWNGSNCQKKPEQPIPVFLPDAHSTGTGGPDIIA